MLGALSEKLLQAIVTLTVVQTLQSLNCLVSGAKPKGPTAYRREKKT